jgi:hypothetical protein
MGKFDKAIDKSEDASDEDKAKAREGKAMMIDSATNANEIISPESANTGKSRGGSGGNDDEDTTAADLKNIKANIATVNKFMESGGVSGPEKDKHDLLVAYNEWITSRNILRDCPDKIKESSIKYTTLLEGKANNNEIVSTYRTKENIKEECKNATDNLIKSATKYIELDRRVKQNIISENSTFPVESIQGFQIREKSYDGMNEIDSAGHMSQTEMETKTGKEGFSWYRGANRKTVENPRLPLYTEQNIGTGPGTGILTWANFYTDCSIQTDATARQVCSASMNNKSTYIKAINNLFFEADTLINVLYQLKQTSGGVASNANNENRIELLKKIVDKQSSEIDLFRQKSRYSYEQYNTLSYVEDSFLFIYYALIILFGILLVKDWISSGESFDKRNIVVLLLLYFYPKYILLIVIWVLTSITKLTQMLGIKNVQFW